MKHVPSLFFMRCYKPLHMTEHSFSFWPIFWSIPLKKFVNQNLHLTQVFQWTCARIFQTLFFSENKIKFTFILATIKIRQLMLSRTWSISNSDFSETRFNAIKTNLPILKDLCTTALENCTHQKVKLSRRHYSCQNVPTLQSCVSLLISLLRACIREICKLLTVT